MQKFLMFIAVPLMAQTAVPISGGQILQAALGAGIQYVTPAAAQNIQNQKQFFSWPSLVGLIVGDGSMGAITGGLTKVVSISPPVMVGLAAIHWAYDAYGQPIVNAAGSNGTTGLAPLLQASTIVTPAIPCPDYTVYASSIKGITLKHAKGTPPQPVVLVMDGADITFAAQVGNGMKSRKFIPLDVLVCPVTTSPASAPRASLEALPTDTNFVDGLIADGIRRDMQFSQPQ